MKEQKEKIYGVLLDELDLRIRDARQQIEIAKESRDSETKSAMGDKYETGREMIQMEMDKAQGHLAKLTEMRTLLMSIDITKDQNEVNLGSLVITDRGRFFISIAIGKVVISDVEYFAISQASPIGQKLTGGKIGQTVDFRGISYKILDFE